MKNNKKYYIVISSVIILLMFFGFISMNLDFRDSDLYKKVRTYIIFRNDVNKIYEDTPFIFQAGKEIKLNNVIYDEESELDQLYEATPFIEEAKKGDGGIIKNKDASILPYSFRYNLVSYLYSSEINIPDMDRIRLAIYSDLDSSSKSANDSYIDVTLFVDDVNYGTYRFEIGFWGYADWYSIPNGSMKIVLTKPDNHNGESVNGIGAILVY